MLILVINPGSTSTKIAVYDDEKPILLRTIRHTAEELSKFEDVIYEFPCRKQLVIDELKPQEGDIIVPKKTYSAFYETPLELILRELGVDTVVITGWQADCCCRHTSADAFFRGFNIIVPRETTDTDTEEGYTGGLAYMEKIYGATICSVNDLF